MFKTNLFLSLLYCLFLWRTLAKQRTLGRMILQEKKELFDHNLIKAIQFDRELADKSVTDILELCKAFPLKNS